MFAIMFSSYVVRPDVLSSVLPFATISLATQAGNLETTDLRILSNSLEIGFWVHWRFSQQREGASLVPWAAADTEGLSPPRAGSWHHQHLPLIPTLLAKVFIQLCLKCIRWFPFSWKETIWHSVHNKTYILYLRY